MAMSTEPRGEPSSAVASLAEPGIPAASHRARPALALAVAVVAVSTGAVFVRLADAPPLVVAFYRCALATAVLTAIGWRACREEWPRLSRRERWIVLATGLGLALHFSAWITSLSYTNVASSVVIVNTTPVWVALLTPVLSTDRLRAGTLAGIAAAVAGCAVIGWGDFELSGRALFGDALALAGAWMSALYMLAGRRLRRRLSLLPYVIACYGAAAVCLLVLVLGTGQPLFGHAPETYGWLVALALVPQLIGHSSYNYALRYLSAASTSVATLGESAGAALLAWWLLGEELSATTLAGGAIVLAGLLVAVRSERAAT
jgi:drug/metabolite transporter (DMT)-like permease